MRRIMLLALLASIAGCGGDEEEAATTPTPTTTATAEAEQEGRFEVAYKVPVDVVRQLDSGNAGQLIREKGEVVASSDFGTETLWVTVDWLEKRGIDVEDPGPLRQTVRRVDKKQHTYLFVVSQDPEVAKAIEALHPRKAKLAAFYDGWGGGEGTRIPQAGEAMFDWIRVFEEAAQAGGDDVVLIPDLH